GPDRSVEAGLRFQITPKVLAGYGAVPTVVGLDFGLTVSELTADGQGVDVQQAETKAAVPDGGTVVVGGMKKGVETRHEYKAPLLGDLPFLGRLFRAFGVGQETVVTVVLMTPHVVREGADDAGCTPPRSAEALPAPMPMSAPKNPQPISKP